MDRQGARVTIEFLDLLADAGPSGIDPSFGMDGERLGGGDVMPEAVNDQDLLVIVIGGDLTIAWSDVDRGDGVDTGRAERSADAITDGCEPASGTIELGPAQFCVIGAETRYSMRAGVGGATFLSSWPQKQQSR